MAKLVELRYELLSHPPYSPDLASCNFYLFPNMKKWLGGKRFASNEKVIAETEAYFKEFDQSYFLNGIKMLEYRWAKCIERRLCREIKKKKFFFKVFSSLTRIIYQIVLVHNIILMI